MQEAERLTLLSRVSGSPRTHLRYHPLVRQFLAVRLAMSRGDEGVRELHRRVAKAVTDWADAAYHFRSAGEDDEVLATLHAAIPSIMGSAQYALAASFLEPTPVGDRPVPHLLVQSRIEMQLGNFDEASAAALRVLDSSGVEPLERDYALLNLVAGYLNSGDGELARQYALLLGSTTREPDLAAISDVTVAILDSSTERDLDALNRRLHALAEEQMQRRPHHFGVTQLNLAMNSLVQDRLTDALQQSSAAYEAFISTSAVVERQAAVVTKASALLRLGRVDQAAKLAASIASEQVQAPEWLELADAFGGLAGPDRAGIYFQRGTERPARTPAERRLSALVKARFELREGRADAAAAAMDDYPDGIATIIGSDAARHVLRGHVALALGAPQAQTLLAEARDQALRAGIHSSRRTAEILLGACSGARGLDRAVASIGASYPWHLAWLADLLVRHLDWLGEEAAEAVARSAETYADRWRDALRRALDSGQAHIEAASLLERVGERQDVARLRNLARSWRKNRHAVSLGRGLARRTATRVFVEDQGRVAIRVGDSEVAGSSVRRKVLALLCFLLSRPGASATRDQVLEALWPDLAPEVAVNSLNQTLYFLRRVFEPDYVEDTSPGYVNHDSEVVWLDAELVDSRSAGTWRCLRAMSTPAEPVEVERLIATYRGRFALDFEYEEWSTAYRDTLHAAYLEVVERAVGDDLTSGFHARAIRWAQRAIEVDPQADSIEVSLLRLYRNSGAHSAAAEQYEHYATYLRDELGLEPPPLESL
jgi:DNA-binding SARP family transcriptional activator